MCIRDSVKSVCPADGVTVREQTKEFVKERCRTDHAFRQKTLDVYKRQAYSTVKER